MGQRIEPNFKPIEQLEKWLLKQLDKLFAAMLLETRNELSKYDADNFLNHSEYVKYNRAQRLEQTITNLIGLKYNAINSTLKQGISTAFEEAYYLTAYTFEKEIQASLSFSLLNPQVIANAIANPIAGTNIGGDTWELTLKKSLERNRNEVIRKTNQAIAQGVIRGEGYSTIARDIKNIYEGDLKKARLIATTETHRVQEDGANKAYQRGHDLGVEMVKIWLSTLDTKTRDAHQELDGVKVGFNDDFKSPNGGVGPFPSSLNNPSDDIRCRCTHIVEVEGFSPKFRAVRNANGKTEQIKWTTYKEWKKSLNKK